MKIFTDPARAVAALTVAVAAVALWGCPNPNAIGVQQFGIVQATCVQASNNQPVSGAIVTVGGVTATSTTDNTGSVTIQQVEIGTHTATADAAGLHGEAPVTVVQNQTVPVRISMAPTT